MSIFFWAQVAFTLAAASICSGAVYFIALYYMRQAETQLEVTIHEITLFKKFRFVPLGLAMMSLLCVSIFAVLAHTVIQ